MTILRHHAERALMGLVGLWFRFVPRPRPERRALLNCKIVSHRGEHDNRRIFENTMAAFECAAEAECWGIEFDVRWTRDLVPVVVHDENLRRVFAIDLDVASVELGELQRRCPQVPTLAQVVERFGGRHHLMVELKPDRLGEIETRTARLRDIFAALQPGRDFHFLALQTGLFELAGFCGLGACLPIVQFKVARVSREVLAQDYAGICVQYLLLSRARIERHRRRRQKLGTGFVDSRNSLYREINRGVDWVFTNRAVQLEAIRRQALRDG